MPRRYKILFELSNGFSFRHHLRWPAKEILPCPQPKLDRFLAVGFNPRVTLLAEHDETQLPTKKLSGSTVKMVQGAKLWRDYEFTPHTDRVLAQEPRLEHFMVTTQLCGPFRCGFSQKPNLLNSL